MNDALDLSILDSGSDDHAVALARCGSDCAIAHLPFGKELAELTQFRDWIESAVRGDKSPPSSAELSAFGNKLFHFTLRDEIKRIYDRLSDNDVRLNILSNRSEVQNLPWEYLQDPNIASGPQYGRSVVRVVPTIGLNPAKPSSLGSRKVRVLFAAAAPTDQDSVDWEDAWDALERSLNSNLPDGVSLKLMDGTDPKALREAIEKQEFDIFHFSGHGQIRSGKGQLVLINRKTKKSEYLGSDEVSTILGGRGIRLVILSACMTATGNFRDEFSVISTALVKSGVTAVVANQMPISNKTIAPFVGYLYGKLMQCGNIDTAITFARIALRIDLNSLEWGIPTLYRHYLGAQLFKP
jgi:CHAT domain-containing protein